MNPKHTSIIDAMPLTTPFVGPEALERQAGKAIRLRLGANESPFGPSPLALEAMREQAANSQNYGDPEGFLVRQELGKQLGVPMDHIVLGAGIDELLGQCCRILVQPGETVVTTLGSYPTFDYGAAGCGANVHRVPYASESLNLSALLEAADQTKAKILYVANPDNPSGSWQSPQQLQRLRDQLPEGCVLLLDEAYFEFSPAILPVDPNDPQIIRLRTFSKAHGLAGMRIAYAIAHESHISALNKIRFHFAVNCVAQAGALASLADRGHVDRVVRESAFGRIEMAAFFSALGLRPLPSNTNFLTVDVGSKARAEAILDALLERAVFIRKPGAPPLDGCIRITVGRAMQRAEFAEIFRTVLRTL
jgi:histidinol-phosphate aminotransferase